MNINTAVSGLATNPYIRPSAPGDSTPTPSTAPSGAASASSGVQTANFSSMTKKELFNWMNGQLRAGKMSFDDSTAFLGMSMDMPVDGSSMVSSSFDTKKINFYDVVQQGIAGAVSRHDDGQRAQLEKALATMKSSQGSISGVNISV